VLHHVSLEVPPDAVERTVAFWEILGFARLPAPEPIAEYVTWLERDANQIHLIHTPQPTVPDLGHPAVVAADFEGTVAALREAGFAVEEADRLWGEPRAFAVAPAGHRVELMRAPPPPGWAERPAVYPRGVTSFPTVRVAAIQATPVILDAEATIEKAIGLLGAAADDGARVVAFPETFVSLYPSNAWAKAAASFSGWDELWERLWDESVDVPGPLTERLAEACREHDLLCGIGINERESERPGTIYNAYVLIGPDGVLHRHRKLMPTMQERIFHGVGAGDDLAVVETDRGRIGGLICWENRMPLARYGVYRGGPQIWLAPTADDSDGWLASVRHIAIESGAFVASIPQYIPAAAFPDDFPVPLPDGREVFGNGGAAIVEPQEGEIIAGPLRGEEGIVAADCDLRVGLHAKRWFDAVGHYAREEVLVRPAAGRGSPAAAPPASGIAVDGRAEGGERRAPPGGG
jgi:nitrilase